MALFEFNANSVAPAAPRDAIPKGRYLAHIVRSDYKQTKAGDGAYIELELDFLEPALQGRKIWDRLNIDNPNEMAVSIARRSLSAICHAVGVMDVRDTEELHFKPLLVSVGFRRDDPEKNEVKGYATAPASAPGGFQPRPAPAPARATGTAQAQAEAQMAQAAAGSNNKPWKK